MQSKSAQRLTILFVIGLFVLPVTYYGLEPERAQWRAASSIRKYQSGDEAAAIEEMTAILEGLNDRHLDLRLSQWLQKDGQYEEALGYGERALKTSLDVGDGFLINQTLANKADCLILLKDRQGAMTTVNSWLGEKPKSEMGIENYLNVLSYYRGLCRSNLVLAKRDMNVVAKKLAGKMDRYPISFHGEVAMAIGLVSRYTDQRAEAIETIANYLEHVEAVVESKRQGVTGRLYQLMQDFLPLNEQLMERAQEARKEVEYYANELIVLKAVLALLHEEKGDDSAAMSLRNEVFRLGADCEEVLESLPSREWLIEVLKDGAVYLDTRGYVCFALEEYEEALRDTNLAVLSGEILLKSWDTPIRNSTETIDYSGERILGLETAATLTNHRAMIYEAMEDMEKAELDRQRVIELGFEPGPELF